MRPCINRKKEESRMKRLHVHVAVQDLQQSIRFYSALFAAAPVVTKEDYAKWMLDDPRVNFAISTRAGKAGVDHLGIQAESEGELVELGSRLVQADVAVTEQRGATCCYAKSDKYWTLDPQGIAWESFHTLESTPVYGRETGAREVSHQAVCCAPAK
jgi:catechol 2,3-dioxygenase-like lactoylglutathione lyase family enzyme